MKQKKVLPIIAMLLVVLMAGCKQNDNPGVPPSVTTTVPANNATGIAINSQITATFSAAMDPLTITTTSFTVKQGTANVAGAVAYSGTTATFTPAANLTQSTIYTATISTGAKNASGTAMTNNFVWSFTTGAVAAPTVLSTDPANLATGVELNKVVTVTFSDAMDLSTLIGANFSIKHGGITVFGTITKTASTVSFDPTNNLLSGTIYTANITTGVKNEAGTALANNHEWIFTTLSIPTVKSTDPLNGATDVLLKQVVTATFSEPMDQTTLISSHFTLKHGTTTAAGSVSQTDTTVSYTPSGTLLPSTLYTATVTTGAKSAAGIAMAVDKVWTFTTAADVAPTVISTDPLNQATGVEINKVVKARFSGSMDPTTLIAANFTLKHGTTPVDGEASHTDTTISFTPLNNLLPGTVYIAIITTGVKSSTGMALANNHEWTFTTVAAAPTVISTNPLNQATGVARNKVVRITFNEAMDPTTINNTTFTLKQGTTPVSGIVAYSGTTGTFTPSNLLEASTTYNARLSTGAKNLAGIAIATAKEWSFTTGSATSGLDPVDLGTAGNYVILAKTAITNISTSNITGDLGLSPAATSYITGLALTDATGFATSAQVTGKIYAADMADPTPINLTTAVENMMTAYTDAAGRPTPDFLELGTGNIGGLTLVSGLYKWTNTVTIPSDVTISGGANDVWIFQIDGDLSMSSAVSITLVGGAQAQNIFWQVAGQATLETTSHFEGIILSMTGITLQTGVSLNGRTLAQTAVALDGVTITQP